MKQKEETKVTTLCRFVAVYNRSLRTPKQCSAARVDVIIVHFAHNIRVRLVLVIGNNNTSIYIGGLDNAIAYMAKRLCGNKNSDVCVAFEFS